MIIAGVNIYIFSDFQLCWAPLKTSSKHDEVDFYLARSYSNFYFRFPLVNESKNQWFTNEWSLTKTPKRKLYVAFFFFFSSNFSQKNSIVDRFIWTFWISYRLHTFLKCFPITIKILSVIQRMGLFSKFLWGSLTWRIGRSILRFSLRVNSLNIRFSFCARNFSHSIIFSEVMFFLFFPFC